MEESITEASSLPSHWSAQQAELYALIQALQLSKGKKTNIYTDSRYAFATLQGSVQGERPLTASEKDIKNKEEIKQGAESDQWPTARKETSSVTAGN